MRTARKPPGKREPTTRIGGVARRIVSPAEWRRAREAMTAKEKTHMRRGRRARRRAAAHGRSTT
jgi:predicted dithiol-disulfide oxidoreductase (DUF899 family)